MRNRLFFLLFAANVLGGCELIVRFDPSRLDARADGMTPDVPRPDVPAGDVADAQDVGDVPAMDVVDVPIVDSADVPIVDVVDAVTADAVDAVTPDAPDVVMPADADDVVVTDVPVDVVAPDVVDVVVADVPADTGPMTYVVMVGAAGLSFSPSMLTINPGDTVRWVWSASFHNVVSGTIATCTPDDRFCSPTGTSCSTAPTSMAGEMYEFRFTTSGSFPYFCAPHCGAGMSGTIVVR